MSKEINTGIIGKITDHTLYAATPNIHFDLMLEKDLVTPLYEKVLKGEITDPARVEEITSDYEDWYRRFYNTIKGTGPSRFNPE